MSFPASPCAKNTIQLILPADYQYLNVLTACVEAVLERIETLPEPETIIYNVQLAVQEICNNIVEHAYEQNPDGLIKITFQFNQAQTQLVVDIFDEGSPFDPQLVPEPDFEVGQIGGWGLYLINKLMDEVTYTHAVDYNHWRLLKKLQ